MLEPCIKNSLDLLWLGVIIWLQAKYCCSLKLSLCVPHLQPMLCVHIVIVYFVTFMLCELVYPYMYSFVLVRVNTCTVFCWKLDLNWVFPLFPAPPPFFKNGSVIYFTTVQIFTLYKKFVHIMAHSESQDAKFEVPQHGHCSSEPITRSIRSSTAYSAFLHAWLFMSSFILEHSRPYKMAHTNLHSFCLNISILKPKSKLHRQCSLNGLH